MIRCVGKLTTTGFSLWGPAITTRGGVQIYRTCTAAVNIHHRKCIHIKRQVLCIKPDMLNVGISSTHQVRHFCLSPAAQLMRGSRGGRDAFAPRPSRPPRSQRSNQDRPHEDPKTWKSELIIFAEEIIGKSFYGLGVLIRASFIILMIGIAGVWMILAGFTAESPELPSGDPGRGNVPGILPVWCVGLGSLAVLAAGVSSLVLAVGAGVGAAHLLTPLLPLVACYAGIHIWSLRRSEHENLRDLFTHYYNYRKELLKERREENKLNNITQNCVEGQKSFLMGQIKHDNQNRRTEYERDHHFAWINSREKFINMHPLTTYNDYELYIEKDLTYEGGKYLATAGKRVLGHEVCVGSGTKPKFIPVTQHRFDQIEKYAFSHAQRKIHQKILESKSLQKNLYISSEPAWTCRKLVKSEVYNHPRFHHNSKTQERFKSLVATYNSRRESPKDSELYINLLLALRDRNLGQIWTDNSVDLSVALKFLEDYLEDLLTDIELGGPRHRLTCDKHREKISAKFAPNPERARELRSEFMKGSKGIARRIWPHLHVIVTMDTDTVVKDTVAMDTVTKDTVTKDTVTKDTIAVDTIDGIPVYNSAYISPAGVLGINLDPLAEKKEFLLCPDSVFYEFIPADESQQTNPRTLFIDQVELGEKYELVITNGCGLYRYRLGDVIRITGYHDNTPKIEIVSRMYKKLRKQIHE